MNNFFKNKYFLFFFFLFVFTSVGYSLVFAQNTTQSSFDWEETITSSGVRYFGGSAYSYSFDQCISSTCSNSCPTSSLGEDYQTPLNTNYGGINQSQEKVMFREITNQDWGLVCDSRGWNESWNNREDVRTGCISSGVDDFEREYLYVDFGEHSISEYYSDGSGPRSGKYMDLRYSVDGVDSGRIDFNSFDDDSKIITISNTESNPDDIRRMEIYVNDKFLKTVFPDPATSVEFTLSPSDLLNIDKESYHVYDGYRTSDNSYSRIDIVVMAYGANSYDSLSTSARFFSESGTYLPDVAPDITVYGGGGSTRRANYFVVNSLDEPVYVNNYYIDPSMTPITIKANQSASHVGNFVKGYGWYLELDEKVFDFDFVDIGYISSSDTYYEGESIGVYVSSYYAGSQNTKVISNVMIDDVLLSPSQYQFNSVGNTISIPGIGEGIHNLKYEISVTHINGNTWEDSRSKDILIVKNDLNEIRLNSFDNDKMFHEILVNFNDRFEIDYTTSWGTSNNSIKAVNVANSETEKTFKQLVTEVVLSDSETGWLREHGDNEWKSGLSGYRSKSGIDYDGSVDFTINFFDGSSISKSLEIKDLVSVSKIKDISGVGTAFNIQKNQDYISREYASNSTAVVEFWVNYNAWEKRIDRSTPSHGYDIDGSYNSPHSTYGNTFMVGNSNYYGILEQPTYSLQYGHPFAQVAVSELEYEKFYTEPVGYLDLGYFNVMNIPFGLPHMYVHERNICPTPDGLTIPIDEPLQPPLPPKPDNFVLTVTTTSASCYDSSNPMIVDLQWGDIDNEVSYSIYLDANNDGLFDDFEKIDDLPQNSNSISYNLKDYSDFAEGVEYSYQVKASLISGSYESSASVVVPAVCDNSEPLCGNLDDEIVSLKPLETNLNLCSSGNLGDLGVYEILNQKNWNWQCNNNVEPIQAVTCSASCNINEWICNDSCQSNSQTCNNGNPCPVGRVLSGGQCVVVTVQSCIDGIQNQDETDIDLGGVCGTGVIGDESTVLKELEIRPRIINSGDSCSVNWSIDTLDPSFVICEISSSNEDLIEIDILSQTQTGTEEFSDVEVSTDYTLSCYNASTDSVTFEKTKRSNEPIISETEKCIINPIFEEF